MEDGTTPWFCWWTMGDAQYNHTPLLVDNGSLPVHSQSSTFYTGCCPVQPHASAGWHWELYDTTINFTGGHWEWPSPNTYLSWCSLRADHYNPSQLFECDGRLWDGCLWVTDVVSPGYRSRPTTTQHTGPGLQDQLERWTHEGRGHLHQHNTVRNPYLRCSRSVDPYRPPYWRCAICVGNVVVPGLQ